MTSNPLIITISLMMVCLFVCVVLFLGMKSTAIVSRPGYRLGGAIAAFVVVLPMSNFIYNNRAKEMNFLEPTDIPPGFKSLLLKDVGLAFAMPSKFEKSMQYAVQIYSSMNSNEQIMILNGVISNSSECENSEYLEKTLRNAIVGLSKYFSIIEIGATEVAPVNGMFSAIAKSTLKFDDLKQQVTFRFLCTVKRDQYVVFVYPTSSESVVMMSTLAGKL